MRVEEEFVSILDIYLPFKMHDEALVCMILLLLLCPHWGF